MVFFFQRRQKPSWKSNSPLKRELRMISKRYPKDPEGMHFPPSVPTVTEKSSLRKKSNNDNKKCDVKFCNKISQNVLNVILRLVWDFFATFHLKKKRQDCGTSTISC